MARNAVARAPLAEQRRTAKGPPTLRTTEQRIVVTGMGAVTPIGTSCKALWRGIQSGCSGVGPIRAFDASGLDTRIAAEVSNYRPRSRWQPRWLKRPEKKTRMLLDALDECLASARIRPASRPARSAGVVVGAELSRPDLETFGKAIFEQGGWLPTHLESAPHLAASIVAERLRTQGPVSTLSLACSSSAAAVAEGMDLIRDGAADVVIAGGTDAQIDPVAVSGFSMLGTLSSRNTSPAKASRPFDADRDGFVIGEGAGVVVLESFGSAVQRNAPILAELAGYGVSANAFSVTGSPPDGLGAARAMAAALTDAALEATDIDYINAHGTSTMDNDASETRAIHSVFGSHTKFVSVSSTKSQMGHLIAAAGVVELIVSILALRNSLAPATLNLENPDRHCALNHVPHLPRRLAIRHAMTNSFGFGGTNVALIASRAAV